jgi:hypothetical protein
MVARAMDKMNQQFRFLLTSLAGIQQGVEHESAVAGAMDKTNQQFRFLLTSLAGIQQGRRA